jgi:hypothetical protein
MRIPGARTDRQEALDEVAAELNSCPVCEGYLSLTDDSESNWDTRVVRVRSCVVHGYFFIKYWPTTKRFSVEWILNKYMPDLKE